MRQLEKDVFVSGQITPEDLPGLAAEGIRTIINNRPDGEVQGQPEGGMIRIAAEQAGIDYVGIPISQITGDAVDDMRLTLERAQRPILAFCAAGTRSTYLWALARRGDANPQDLEAAAAAAGYDLTPIRPYLS